MMNLKELAKRPTALIAGALAGFSIAVFETWMPLLNLAPDLSRLTYIVGVLLLWVVPGALFVIGIDPKRWDPDYKLYSPEYHADQREVMIRVLFWTAGTIVCATALR